MVLLNFSYTGESTTGDITFALTQEYKFKNLFLKDIKYNIKNEKLEEKVGGMTSNTGLGQDTTITSALAIQMDFLDSKDCVTYGYTDAPDMSGGLTAANITGLIPFGYAGKQNDTAVSDSSTISHSYPYHLINNRPQTWAKDKVLTFKLYFRDVQTDGLIKAWTLMSGTTDAFSDVCDISITLQLE